VFDDRLAATQVILKKTGFSINAQGVTGNSLLMFASLWGKFELAAYLLQQNADYSLKNTKNETALSLANKSGHRSIVKLLRDYGAKT
jgi:ankyrin repeat protein